MNTNKLDNDETGLEKSSTILLTQQDLDELSLGRVSERVRDTWHLTLEQLRKLVENNDYVKN